MHRVAFLGLGAMGSRMASNLIAAGHDVVVWNRSQPARERLASLRARPAVTPREAASSADVVISMVTDDDASRAVWLAQDTGAASGLVRGAIAIESSTVSSEWVGELAAAVMARGARFLDCPVAGSLPQAEARQLLVLAGGDESAFETAKPVLEAMAGAAKHVGAAGQGIALKLAVNTLLGIQIAAMAEALNYVEQAGLPAAHVIAILATTPLVSPAAIGAAKLIEARDFKPRFPVKLVAEDFRYAVESGKRIGADLPMTAAAQILFDRLSSTGFGEENISAARLYDQGR
jgi:3-hydroxyisobutyrate dehydrogenase-like beta-hydroxyacid dehydrogenase